MMVIRAGTRLRLWPGRVGFTVAERGLLFMAGANSIFNGDKLLTTANPSFNEDTAMFERMGLTGKPAHIPHKPTPYIVKVTHSTPQKEEEVYAAVA